ALHAGAVPVTVYSTLSPTQVAWYARKVRPKVVVLEGATELERWAEALADPELGDLSVVVVDEGSGGALRWSELVDRGRARRTASPAELAGRAAEVRPEDPATILFTSGTTGDPKGVVLTHTNVLYEVVSADRANALEGEAITLSYLPLAHIAERVLGLYFPQVHGGHVHLVGDLGSLVTELSAVRPTRFFGVPRVWEKIMTGVSARLAAEPDEARRQAVSDAMAVGRRWVEAQQAGGEVPADLAEQYAAADATVLTPLRSLLGLDRAEWTVSAAAPMPAEVASFFAGLGLKMLDVYGMTETTAAICAGRNSDFKLNTVGRPYPGIEIRIADDGEILARGPVLTPGYLDNAAATAKLIDADGWVHTGDIGYYDDDGFLRVVDRKSEMIINTYGKNIAPSVIEGHLKESPLVGHAMVVGEGRPYLVALLTLDPEVAPAVAAALGVTGSLADLAASPVVLETVQEAVDAANALVSRPEQVKRFALLPGEWTAETLELTPTLKLKRRVISSTYAEAIEKLYATP
ncbi:MAG: long-chain fatty acid--CoA ligase, partial [Nocardioides sp.]|nr:long-chain fatty acid--CoA ligase [Nocardioides sp.]